MHCRDKIIKFALPYIKSYRTYVDVGADVGSTSEPFLKKFNHIIAFEPNPEQFVELSQITSIESYALALGDIEGMVELKVPEHTMNPGHGSTAPRRNRDWQGLNYTVPMRTLDSFNFDNVDFIKIDVEQGELEVILGALDTIKRCRPVVMFENKRQENKQLVKMFKDWGYKVNVHSSDVVAY